MLFIYYESTKPKLNCYLGCFQLIVWVSENKPFPQVRRPGRPTAPVASPVKLKTKWKKQKSFWELRNGELERSGKRSYRIQSPEYQELSAAAAAVPLITLKSSETQNVDLTDKVRANHYFRHFERRSALHAMNRTGSFRYMSEETSESAQLQGCMLEYVRRKETQRIRTATNFFETFCSPQDVFSLSVTNVADSRVLQTSYGPLKIVGKTLSPSIAAEKCTVVSWEHSVASCRRPYLPPWWFFELLERALTFFGSQFCNFGTSWNYFVGFVPRVLGLLKKLYVWVFGFQEEINESLHTRQEVK